MKEEFGKWLLDISKYMVTALLLSTIFTDITNPLILGLVVIIAMIILACGLHYVKVGKKEENKQKKGKKQ